MAKNYVYLSDMERAFIQAKLATLALDHQPRAQACNCRASSTAM